MKKKLFIFTNEDVFLQNNRYFCENIDIKSTPEGLNKNFEVNLFCRKSSKKMSTSPVKKTKTKKTKKVKKSKCNTLKSGKKKTAKACKKSTKCSWVKGKKNSHKGYCKKSLKKM